MRRLEPGSHFAGYVIEGTIARGAMSVVYRVRRPDDGRILALKLLAPELSHDENFRRRFERESRIAAAIRHPNVVVAEDSGRHDDAMYIVMAFINGTDLRRRIARTGPFEAAAAVRIVTQVAGALDAGHAAGLVHRDVKPANILLSATAPRSAFLTDFGLSKQSGDERLTRTGEWVGSLDYLAPEAFQGEAASAGADIYALGCVLYEALTGHPPFRRDNSVATLWGHVNDPPPSPSAERAGVPAALDEVVARAMAKQPVDRYASAGELAAGATRALQAARAGQGLA